MAWEWLILMLWTIAGPILFRSFLVTRQVATIRAGTVFVLDYSTAAQVARCALKFAVFWFIAALLAQQSARTWLRAWVLGMPALVLVIHAVLVRKHRVHWLTGRVIHP